MPSTCVASGPEALAGQPWRPQVRRMTRAFPSPPPVDDRALYDLQYRRFAAPMAALAQEAGLCELLLERPRTTGEVADALGVTRRAAEAMVAVVAALGFARRTGGNRFALTDFGSTYLLPASPFGRRLCREDDPTLQELRGAFRSGEPAAPLAVAMEALPEAEVREFIGRMHALTLPAAGSLARQPVFVGVERLLDVGAGSGSLSAAVAAAHPGVRCTLLDLPEVCAIAAENIRGYGLEDRVVTCPADMFRDPWPPGHDAALFGNIFHDWDPPSCARLARRAFEALEPGGRILLHEMPLAESRDGPLTVACFSVAMLLYEKGKQYTLSELEEMLAAAGFVGFESVESHGYYHLVSARKPE